MRRKIKESLFINISDKGNEISNLMNLERGLAIDSCWRAMTDDMKIARKDGRLRTTSIGEMCMQLEMDRETS